MRNWAYNCEFIKDCYDIFVWPLVNNGVWGWGWYLDPAIVIFCSVSDCYCENRAQVATLALGGAARLPDMLSEIVIIINKCPRSLLVRGFELVSVIQIKCYWSSRTSRHGETVRLLLVGLNILKAR